MGLPSGEVTLLFTDIEGSTHLWEVAPEAMAIALRRHDAILRTVIEAHEGHVFKTVGDAFCAAFPTAPAAVAAAVDAQLRIGEEPWPPEAVLRVRMGLHSGQCEERDGDYFGPVVNRAARLEAAAHGGQVVLSAATVALAGDPLAAGVNLSDLGEHRLKDLSRPERIYEVQALGLPGGFPPLRTLDNPLLPNNLPAQSDSFIGRASEVAEVRSLVEQERLVTLTGAGGVGKSRLALQVAADLLDGSGDGVWLVELAPVPDEHLVAATMNDVLGVTGQPGRLELDALLDALEPQRALIVLDNCEHLIETCAKVADAVLQRCPQVHLVVTSREPLGIRGETVYRVPSLALPDDTTAGAPEESDAVALFLDRARAQGADVSLDHETGPLLVSICRRLDGMPLAIELAAARVRSMSLATIHDRLDQRFRLLTGGSRSALPRQQTLRATVEWSYSLLNDAEHSVLRHLSVFSESFDLEAVEAVCTVTDLDVLDIADLVGSLVDKSLVVAELKGSEIRFRLLETIRQFSAEHLVERDGDEAEASAAAHCSHFLSVAERAAAHLAAGPQQSRWHARLMADDANIRRAVEYAVEVPGNTALALRFASALARHWIRQPRAAEVVAPLASVLERPDADSDPELLARASVSIAMILTRERHEMGLRVGEQAVHRARQLGDGPLLVEALGSLSVYRSFGGDVESGISLSEEAVALARVLGDDVALARSLGDYLLAVMVGGEFDPSEIERLWAEAVIHARRAGDMDTAAGLSSNAACTALIGGDIATARSYLEQAGGEDAPGIERAGRLINLGWVNREEGDRDTARANFQESLLLGRRSGERREMAYALLGLACLAGDGDDWHRAAQLHGVAQGFANSEPWSEPEGRYSQASLSTVRDQLTDHEFQRAFGHGLSMSFDDAMALALGGHRAT